MSGSTNLYPAVPVRIAGPDDIDRAVAAITTAFFDDPIWGPAFPDADRRADHAGALWRLFVTSGLRYPWVLVTEQVEAVALWIPPGALELTQDEEDGFAAFIEHIVSQGSITGHGGAAGRGGMTGHDVAAGIVDILTRLEEVHPAEPHYYLSLLATHDRHRGKAMGMGLLIESLARIDALHGAAYLESCNPVNDDRYESVGFEPRDRVTVESGHVVTTMWRGAR